ncbi:pyrroline-5-carboxylate reductase [Cohnella fermenti]|uniref:Pyrroline-5-carboxylate reductase n=1 Tax=Cohnella fermenti TaxID=2565925 RepID=A0A4S4C2E7_9BACL|nr:pyrroline-5-carboxylate reductase [Cohnella fermenti]THF81209.1 pyrroline-5-carboxylate reductase [Cohnella fermenti]
MTTASASSSSLLNKTIVFYGAGSMAEAIVRGIVETGVAAPGNVTVLNRSNGDRLLELQKRYGVVPALTEEQKNAALAESDIVVLGMKPKDSATALLALKPHLRPNQLIVSLIAGLTIGTIQQLLASEQPVIRTMPNTSSSIGLGATGISFSASVPEDGRALALSMFQAIGIAAVVEENLLQTVTAVSGSGPAYIYYMMEAMIRSGIEQGLSLDAASELVVQTVRGAAEMVRTTGEDPAELRRKVTSPNGTTQAAIETLERLGFPEAIDKAMLRCAERAEEMGQAIADEAFARK